MYAKYNDDMIRVVILHYYVLYICQETRYSYHKLYIKTHYPTCKNYIFKAAEQAN